MSIEQKLFEIRNAVRLKHFDRMNYAQSSKLNAQCYSLSLRDKLKFTVKKTGLRAGFLCFRFAAENDVSGFVRESGDALRGLGKAAA